MKSLLTVYFSSSFEITRQSLFLRGDKKRLGYERELRETNISIENMLNAIQQGILTRSTKERLEALEKTKEDLENKIACEKMAKPRYTAEQLTFFLHRFRKLDMTQQSHRKMLIDTFVNAIFLYDDKLMLGLNFHEGTTTITFEDLQETIENEGFGSDLNSVGAPTPEILRVSGIFVLKSI
ncbi:MAG: hypothetical protein IJ662_03345 [Clostridia bacterium]|nr:hypothetical protein [Clostridia bacterium]